MQKNQNAQSAQPVFFPGKKKRAPVFFPAKKEADPARRREIGFSGGGAENGARADRAEGLGLQPGAGLTEASS